MVTGVGSGGLDVASLVAQLMQVERQPLGRLQQREAQMQARLSAFGRVQGAAAALDSAVNALTRAATFSATRVGVGGEGVAAAASGTPEQGRYAIAVSQLARGQSTASARIAGATTDIGAGAVTIRSGDGATVLGTFHVGDAGTGTLTELRDEINAADIAVRASLVGDAGQVRLVLNSRETGAAGAFQVSVGVGLPLLSFTTQQNAQDAAFSVNGLALSSPTNIVTDAIEGVSLTLTKAPPADSPPGTTVDGEVTIDRDTAKTAGAVRDFVKAYNDFEKLIGESTRFDGKSRSAALLNGESVLRAVQGQVRSVIRAGMTAAAGDYTRLSEIGVSVQADGLLAVDEAKLGAAIDADADKVARLFTAASELAAEQGFAVRLRTTVKSIIDADGTLDSRQQGLRASIKLLDEQQARMEVRLALIEQRLRRQYSALDALLATGQTQSNALANALAGLPGLKP